MTMDEDDLLLAMLSIVTRGEHAHPDRADIKAGAELLRSMARDWYRAAPGTSGVGARKSLTMGRTSGMIGEG